KRRKAEKAKEQAAKDKSKGQGEAKEGSDGGSCVWTTDSLSVGGFLLNAAEESMDPFAAILDEGHTNGSPFSEKLVFSCGGIGLRFKYDFYVGSPCDREGKFTKPVVSANIRF